MIRMLLKFLNQPYPEPLRNKRSWLLIIGISSIVFFVLALFQPFGLYSVKSEYKLFYICGYSIVTGVALIIFLQLFPILFKKTFSEDKWKVWKHIVWLLTLVMVIGVGNLLYTSWFIGQIGISWYSVFVFEGFTFAVAIIPIVLTVSLSYIRYLKRNLKVANEITDTIDPNIADDNYTEDAILIEGDNKNEKVFVRPSSFYYAKSEGNYLQLHYAGDDNEQQEMIRLTLNNLIKIFEGQEHIMQCHRAYIVNINEISSVAGNAQGLRLKLKSSGGEIPVSRNYVNKIRALI